MEVSITITPDMLANVMTSAIEGNHMTRAWCAGVYLKGERGEAAYKAKVAAKNTKTVWYAHPLVYEGPFKIEVVEIIDESKEAKGKNLRRHLITQDDVMIGLSIMAREAPARFGELINAEDGCDIYGADIFLQCVALGKIVYG